MVQRAGELLSEIEKQKTGPEQLKSPEGQKLTRTQAVVDAAALRNGFDHFGWRARRGEEIEAADGDFQIGKLCRFVCDADEPAGRPVPSAQTRDLTTVLNCQAGEFLTVDQPSTDLDDVLNSPFAKASFSRQRAPLKRECPVCLSRGPTIKSER